LVLIIVKVMIYLSYTNDSPGVVLPTYQFRMSKSRYTRTSLFVGRYRTLFN